MIPHETVMKAIQREGRSFFRTKLDGISDRIYVTKRMDIAVCHWVELRRRSFSRL